MAMTIRKMFFLSRCCDLCLDLCVTHWARKKSRRSMSDVDGRLENPTDFEVQSQLAGQTAEQQPVGRSVGRSLAWSVGRPDSQREPIVAATSRIRGSRQHTYTLTHTKTATAISEKQQKKLKLLPRRFIRPEFAEGFADDGNNVTSPYAGARSHACNQQQAQLCSIVVRNFGSRRE